MAALRRFLKKHSHARVPGHVRRRPRRWARRSAPSGGRAYAAELERMDGREPRWVGPPDHCRAHEEAAANGVQVDRAVRSSPWFKDCRKVRSQLLLLLTNRRVLRWQWVMAAVHDGSSGRVMSTPGRDRFSCERTGTIPLHGSTHGRKKTAEAAAAAATTTTTTPPTATSTRESTSSVARTTDSNGSW